MKDKYFRIYILYLERNNLCSLVSKHKSVNYTLVINPNV